ncbi:MAG: type II secretion system F family protein [Candidatus Omnitrophica bacterium]|nr:type II secretion system F family protein [Candidatus Omnitrophota bacterium]
MVLIYLLIIIGIMAVLAGLLGMPSFSSPRMNFTPKQNQSRAPKALLSQALGLSFPFSKLFLENTKLSAKMKNRLDSAHVGLTPAAFFNLKLILAVVLNIAAFFTLQKIDPVVIIFCLFFGYMVPDIWLNRKVQERKEKIVKTMPETVDLLGLCVEAGLDFASAVKWVIEKTPHNPMVEELAFVLEEIRWGKPRTQALKDMSTRLQVSEITSFVQTLVLAERMGTPVSEAFAILSEDTRLQRYHRGERIAMKAPLKILIPLIFFILPVIAIVIGGPIFLQFMDKKMF